MASNNETSKNVRSHWNKVGSEYSDSWRSGAKPWMSEQELKFIEKHIPKNKSSRCLDIGSGNGRIIDRLLSNGLSNITGYDISDEMVRFLSDKYKNRPDVNVSKIEHMLDVKGNYDLMTLIRVLKYNKDWRDSLSYLISLLNKDGVMIFTIPNKYSTVALAKYPIFKDKISIGELNALLERDDIEVLEIDSKFRLPDIFYSLGGGVLPKYVIAKESILIRILPKRWFGKIFFVAIRKK